MNYRHSRKERLETEKLAIEVARLKSPWSAPQNVLGAVLAVVTIVGAVLQHQVSSIRHEIELEKAHREQFKIKKENETLLQSLDQNSKKRMDLSEQLSRLKNELADTRSELDQKKSSLQETEAELKSIREKYFRISQLSDLSKSIPPSTNILIFNASRHHYAEKLTEDFLEREVPQAKITSEYIWAQRREGPRSRIVFMRKGDIEVAEVLRKCLGNIPHVVDSKEVPLQKIDPGRNILIFVGDDLINFLDHNSRKH